MCKNKVPTYIIYKYDKNGSITSYIGPLAEGTDHNFDDDYVNCNHEKDYCKNMILSCNNNFSNNKDELEELLNYEIVKIKSVYSNIADNNKKQPLINSIMETLIPGNTLDDYVDDLFKETSRNANVKPATDIENEFSNILSNINKNVQLGQSIENYCERFYTLLFGDNLWYITNYFK